MSMFLYSFVVFSNKLTASWKDQNINISDTKSVQPQLLNDWIQKLMTLILVNIDQSINEKNRYLKGSVLQDI